jgi:hypothetical protein
VGGSKGGSADPSGMYEAMASAQAAQESYALGTAQLQWSQQVWNQEQPLINESEQAQINLSNADAASVAQMQQESADQWALYQQYYQPLEETYVNQAENWASPDNIALVTGQAQAGVAEQTQAGLNTAAEQLRSYGINPSSPRYASLYTGANVIGGAAQAAAGTSAAQNLKLQQLALEAGAINTGRGVANTTGSLTNAATGASSAGSSSASGASSTAQQNLATGTQSQTAATNWFNTGATNMNTYVNAVNGYNQAQLGYAQVGAQQTLGIGSLLGGLAGFVLAKGGPAEAPQQGIPVPPNGTPGGYVSPETSPSGGQVTDDVPAQLTVGEFVIPKDVTQWRGQEYWVNEIDKARQEQQEFKGRQDIGGEPAQGIPNQQPTFVSRPGQQGPQQAQPQQAQPQQMPPPQQQIPQQGIPAFA